MDDDLQLFEAELKRLEPTAPSRALVAGLERELGATTGSTKATARPRKARAQIHWVWFGTIPAAAALALLLSRNLPQAPARQRPLISAPVAAGAVLKPVEAENVLYSARDEGLVVLEDGTTARRERLQFVDTITWRNPRTNASLRWTVPREEVRVVPISFQ